MTPMSRWVAGNVWDSSLKYGMDIIPLTPPGGVAGGPDRLLPRYRRGSSRHPAPGAECAQGLSGADDAAVRLAGDGSSDAALHRAGPGNLAAGATPLSRG